ncbi:MAG: Na/Pi cotransporter family protein [Firmicutes bacterium]|nr:Na/Pi cotransporter family protein [Bacillota bacterium]MDY6161289.1 Na/Pi cotransporter family protein [Candidatus Faecousia sp.]
MTVTNLVELLGGLGAFLFGMKYMGDGLELAAGSKMKDLLEKLTRNRFLGFLLGVFVTVVIQSSSATTVMVMGFINAGIMDLAQATGVIFGANIGTTITSILIALDVSGIAPFCICVGAFMMLYSKKAKVKHIGQVILGFGLLFQGLHTMSGAMKPLGQVAWFQNFIAGAKSPILGILVGALICAVIQSSSAAVGILQALALQGLMPLHFASYLICGINIGSAMPTILASMSARNNAKRAAMIYLIYNVVGGVIMTLVTMFLPYTELVERLIPDPMFQVSVVHILFKVVSAVILLPCTNLVVKLTYKLIPKQKHEDAARLEFIDVNLVGNPSVSLLQIRSEVDRMSKLVGENISLAMDGVLNNQVRNAQTITENESVIDYLTDAISDYLVKFNVHELSTQEAMYVNRVYQALNDLERIGDYAEHLLHVNERSTEKNVAYSEVARNEALELYDNVKELYSNATARFYSQNISIDELKHLARLERENRKKAKQAQQNHMDRLRAGECSAEAGIMFGEVLNSLNRIGGHSINIAEAAVVQQSGKMF